MFHGEHGIALHALHGNHASSRSEGEVSWFFSSCGGNLGYILELRGGWPFKTRVVQQCQDSCLVTRDTSGISLRLCRARGPLLEVRQETEFHFLVGTVILGFLSLFKKSKASSPFEALNSVGLSRCQSDMIPPVQRRPRPTAFSRVSTGDSDIPSCCEMKDEPAFKPLQGNPAFF